MDGVGGVLNVVDVEATCWAGEPPAGQVSEIIEIGLTTVDLGSGERTGRYRLLVRPARSVVSGFCTELTGLTQQEVDGGIGFAEACRVLAAEHHAGSRAWASWGDYDKNQFRRADDAWNIAALVLRLRAGGNWPQREDLDWSGPGA